MFFMKVQTKCFKRVCFVKILFHVCVCDMLMLLGYCLSHYLCLSHGEDNPSSRKYCDFQLLRTYFQLHWTYYPIVNDTDDRSYWEESYALFWKNCIPSDDSKLITSPLLQKYCFSEISKICYFFRWAMPSFIIVFCWWYLWVSSMCRYL